MFIRLDRKAVAVVQRVFGATLEAANGDITFVRCEGPNPPRAIARSLVDVEDRVSVEMLQNEECTVFRLRVDASDIGKVVGHQGRTERSLRTILIGAGMKAKRRFSLDIVKEQ